MSIRIEDNFEDVLGKAVRGRSLSVPELSARSGLPEAKVRALLAGMADPPALRQIAPVLGLNGNALAALAEHRDYPEDTDVSGLAAFTDPFPVPGYAEMTVNSYLVWDAFTREAFAFDTGAGGKGILETLEAKNLSLKALLLTHTHRDHVAALDAVRSATGNPAVYVHEREALAVEGAVPIRGGHCFRSGTLSIEARLTDGHSIGGCSYVISGLERPVAIVGDSIFCLSQGGASADQFETALRNNRREILSLPDETVLCPGHGPMTTVAFEKAHNPFFA